jgi:hypothetical protein
MTSRREFVRVHAAIELEYEVIPEREWEQWESGSLLVSRRQRDHLSGETDYSLSRTLSGQLDPEVARFLDHLDKKLACLLDLVSHRQDEPESESRMVPTVLSGCGMSFPCGDLDLDNHVFLTMRLTANPMSRIEVVGTVVRVSGESGELRTVGVSFDQITEADREAIIRYTFQIQRELAKLNLRCIPTVDIEE